SWQPTLGELYSPGTYGWPPLLQSYPTSTDLPQTTRKRRREPRSRPAKRAAVSDSASSDTDSGMAAKKAQHECSQCGKRFATVSNTKRHERTQHGSLPRRRNTQPPHVAFSVDLPCTATPAMPPAASRHTSDVPDVSTKI
ncbi:hypothetical protein H4R19_006199, partial [Coemansia spiralis]